jgi:hypothetical protein
MFDGPLPICPRTLQANGTSSHAANARYLLIWEVNASVRQLIDAEARASSSSPSRHLSSQYAYPPNLVECSFSADNTKQIVRLAGRTSSHPAAVRAHRRAVYRPRRQILYGQALANKTSTSPRRSLITHPRRQRRLGRENTVDLRIAVVVRIPPRMAQRGQHQTRWIDSMPSLLVSSARAVDPPLLLRMVPVSRSMSPSGPALRPPISAADLGAQMRFPPRNRTDMGGLVRLRRRAEQIPSPGAAIVSARHLAHPLPLLLLPACAPIDCDPH